MKRILNKATAKEVTGISPVWIVPAVALLIALWLAVQARMERGTVIEITFDVATDIIAGQTQIKLNEVKIGLPIPCLTDLMLRQIVGDRCASA